jgi:DNA-binding transcriptional regulator LsrR (DeoR family)
LNTEELELLTRVASLYYLEDATQEEVAKVLGFSRPKVARLLERARSEGIVEIGIRPHPALNVKLESEVAGRFGLSQAILVADQISEEAQRMLAARAVGDLLIRNIQDGLILAVGMGRNLAAIPDQLTNPPARDCAFVSAIGGSARLPDGANANDVARRLAESFRGRALSLFAPAFADSEPTRAALMEHPHMRDTLTHARAADVAIVGIGDPSDSSAFERMDWSAVDVGRAGKAGAVTEILGSLFDEHGHEVVGATETGVIGLSPEDLRAIPRVIAMTSEAHKAPAVRAALRTGIIDILVTSVSIAQQLLPAVAAWNDRPVVVGRSNHQ